MTTDLNNLKLLTRPQLWSLIKTTKPNYIRDGINYGKIKTMIDYLMDISNEFITDGDIRLNHLTKLKKSDVWKILKSTNPNYLEDGLTWKIFKPDMIRMILDFEFIEPIDFVDNVLDEINQLDNDSDKIKIIFEKINTMSLNLPLEYSPHDFELYEELKNIIFDIVQNNKYYVELRDFNGNITGYTLSNVYVQDLFDKFKIQIDENETYGSDEELTYTILYKPIQTINVEKLITKEKFGGMFHYINTNKYYNVTKLQIYNSYKQFTQSKFLGITPCLIESLTQSGLSSDKIIQLKDEIINNFGYGYEIKTTDLTKISNNLNICVKLYKYKDTIDEQFVLSSLSNKCNIHGDKNNDTYEIGLYRGHYFGIFKMNCSTFPIKNYHKIIEIIDSNMKLQKKFEIIDSNHSHIFSKITEFTKLKNGSTSLKTSSKVFTKSNIILKNLVRCGFIEFDKRFGKVKDFGENLDSSKITLTHIEQEQTPFQIPKSMIEEFEPDFNGVPESNIFFGDLESIVTTKNHNGFLFGVVPTKNGMGSVFDNIETKIYTEFSDFLKYITFGTLNDNLMWKMIKSYNTIQKLKREIVKLSKMVLKKDIDTDVIKKDSKSFLKFQLEFSSVMEMELLYDVDTDVTELLDDDLKKLLDDTKKMLSNEQSNYYKINKLQPSKRVVYFHNLKYDFNVFKSITGGLELVNKVEQDGSIYSVSYKNYNHVIEFRDSYKLIPIPLKNFQKNFDLKVGKMDDFDLYDLYDFSNIYYRTTKNTSLKFNEFQKRLPQDVFEKYLNHNGDFLHMEIYYDYLRLDCETLKYGMLSFNENIQEISNLKIWDSLTLSTLSHKYFIKRGCYDGTYQNRGHLREFLTQNNVGGRTCSKDNVKQYINNDVDDLDAVALYSSSMWVCKYPLGKCKMITDFDTSKLDDYDHYVIRCTFTINKPRQIPGYSYLDENGVREWSNVFNENGENVFNKIDIESFREYHNISDLKIIEGVYYDSGFTTTHQTVIEDLFNSRKQYKFEGNKVMDFCVKLIMNSSYGKLSQKPNNTKSVCKSLSEYSYVNKENIPVKNYNYYKTYLSNNFDKIRKVEHVDKFNVVIDEYKPIYNYKNSCHLGGIILSTSKQIMNKVMKVMDDNNINIYYTDTDSIHLDKKDSRGLNDLFKNEYGNDLIGNNMGQFHSDFDHIDLKNPWSKKLIVLGKKSYLDVLTDDTGIERNHVRFKGCNIKNLEHYCNQNNLTMMELYESFYNGDSHQIDLCGGCVRFDFNEHGVQTKKKFVKTFDF